MKICIFTSFDIKKSNNPSVTSFNWASYEYFLTKKCNSVSFFTYHLDGQTMWWLYFKIICQGNVGSINDEGINSSKMITPNLFQSSSNRDHGLGVMEPYY
jgi:hypothetical protein